MSSQCNGRENPQSSFVQKCSSDSDMRLQETELEKSAAYLPKLLSSQCKTLSFNLYPSTAARQGNIRRQVTLENILLTELTQTDHISLRLTSECIYLHKPRTVDSVLHHFHWKHIKGIF